jgi:archaemetzincin
MTIPHNRLLWFGGLGLMVGAAALPLGARDKALDLDAIRAAGRKIKSLHTRKGKPRPGDWLAEHHEDGQTFDEYRRSDPNRPTRKRTTIYVQPLGGFNKLQDRLVEDTIDMLGRFYGAPVKKLKPLGLDVIPAKARRLHPTTRHPQILSGYVLRLLKPRRPKDAVAVIALTASDLWPGKGWNFVFGEASLRQRVGVWSLARYGNPAKNYPRVLRRTLQTALHETGHMFGIDHCIAYECGMNGSNSLEESDRGPMGFCPECEQKIWWAFKTDPVKRYRRLVEFAKAHDLKEEAKVWQASLDALTKR